MKSILTIVLLLSAVCAQGQQPFSAASRQVVFEDVNVIPMDKEEVLTNQAVVVQGGRIISMGPLKKVTYDPGALVVAASGKYLMPGLAEMHAHVPPNDDLEPMKEVLQLFMLNGITTIRGMLGHPRHLELRRLLQNGEIRGPHFYTTGPSFNGMSVTSPEAGAAMVRKQKEDGYDYLKLHPGLTRQKFDAIAAAAKDVGIPFSGHVSFGVGVWRAADAGYSTIDHLDGFVEALVPGIEKMTEQDAGLFGMFVADQVNPAGVPALMKTLRKNNVWVVPTQALAERWFHPDFTVADFTNDPHHVYVTKELEAQWISSKENLMKNPRYNAEKIKDFIETRRVLIHECQKNGVDLLLGCDAPQVFNVPGFSTHHELEYLVLAGLTPYEALRTGTTNVARYLGRKDTGVIREGAVSDLILLRANPLSDITNTLEIDGVMRGDQWMPRTYIDSALEKLKKQ